MVNMYKYQISESTSNTTSATTSIAGNTQTGDGSSSSSSRRVHDGNQVGASPMHVRILEKSLDLTPFLNNAHTRLAQLMQNTSPPISDDSDTEQYETLIEEKKIDQSIYYNFNNVGEDRHWLRDLLLSMDNNEEIEYSNENIVTEEDLKRMLKQHVYEKKYRKMLKKKPKYGYYKYYGASLLSQCDMYAENQKHNIMPKKKDKEVRRNVVRKVPKKTVSQKQQEMQIKQEQDDLLGDENDWEDNDEDDLIIQKFSRSTNSHGGVSSSAVHSASSKSSSKRNSVVNTPEQMAIRRRKLWVLMCKKEMGKVQRAKANNHKEQLQTCKRTAQLCMKVCRQKAMQSQKNMKETLWRCKRLTREMQSYWKRYDRVEREMRRRMEKEAEEQRKMDVEMIEAKRQQRKLNFLITQTELYAHFMSRKLGQASPEEQLRILNQLEEKKVTRLAPIDDYDSEAMKAKAKRNVIEAIENDRARTKQFDRQLVNHRTPDIDIEDFDLKDATANIEEEHPQPALFKGHLKGYQLKGMNWLANLYDQGISGILADEMGLGKTVQSIAFLCHVAEKYSVWGPFLVISPASTLHNWQQEMARFVPDFRVVPYWGNPNERKILRQFWEQKDLHTKEASFHVVITSYQIIITDFKYFNRIKWQYMILDEAQAIKSSSSVRWKMLLGFSCRNRLLLSGTPIQNSMAELWALLHFIMPTLFDSHDEFNEWFSKDIENHVENKTGIDEKHLSRLHMILKPFMLRRIKKDVENELSDKIEIMVYCPLTRRQNLLYMALKKKIRIEDLLHYTTGGSSGDTSNVDKNFTSNLMNLVMQFRKVCNHPELFERRDAKSPVFIQPLVYIVPKLIYIYGSLYRSQLQHLLFNKLYIWSPEYISESIYASSSNQQAYNCFSFRSFINLSPQQLFSMFINGILELVNIYLKNNELYDLLNHRNCWWDRNERNDYFNTFILSPLRTTSYTNINISSQLGCFNFTQPLSEFKDYTYTFTEHRTYKMSEYCVKTEPDDEESELYSNNIGFSDSVTPCQILFDQPTIVPLFLFCYAPKVESKSIELYCSCSELALYKQRIHSQANLIEHVQIDNSVYSMTSRIINNIKVAHPVRGWFNIVVPDKETLVTDAGKLSVLDPLLKKLKQEGHRVLIYSQMTKMIDLLEEYMWHRKHKYMRLDGSSKISERRDMVADFQARSDIFVFLLSTRAGGLGINLTAADTVIFYDSDWNPTVDQQAMDRAHRLGQTKQVTVYRLICKGTIEERILQRAREKSEIQRMVISGGNFKPDTLKPKEVVSLLLDDEEIELKYRQKAEERKNWEEARERKDRDRKRKQFICNSYSMESDGPTSKKLKEDVSNILTPESRSGRSSPLVGIDSEGGAINTTSVLNTLNGSNGQQQTVVNGAIIVNNSVTTTGGNNFYDDSSNDGILDIETPPMSSSQSSSVFSGGSNNPPVSATNSTNKRVVRGGTRRGRPRGSRRGGGTGSKGRELTLSISGSNVQINNIDLNDISVNASGGSSELTGDDLANDLLIDIDSGLVDKTKSIPIRRGPGRPRLKPVGPSNQGTRGVMRPRKPVRALPVPLRSLTSTNHLATSSPSSSGSQPNVNTVCFNFYGSNSVTSSPNSSQS